jgi:hypothetical protein
VVHRRTVVSCPSLLPRPGGGACTSMVNATASEPCAADADCTKRPNGFCTTVPTSHYPGCGCVYGCIHDGDCGTGEICECGDPVGTCVKAACAEDKACPSGSLCASVALSWGGCSFNPPAIGFQCQTTRDACLTDQSCAAGAPACAFDTNAGVRGCHQAQLACP